MQFQIQHLPGGRVIHYALSEGGRPLGMGELLRRWQDDPDCRACFTARLAGAPFEVFRWETPPLIAATLDRPAEFVLVDAPEIDLPPDSSPFTEHFRDTPVVAFDNLGGDGLMIAPCPQDPHRPRVPEAAYAHFAAFLRRGPEAQVDALWQAVGAAVLDRVGPSPLWLSTAGGGVAWLHVRLDSWPKYYAYAPYRTA